MHSRIITLNQPAITEDEIFEMMPAAVDYVVKMPQGYPEAKTILEQLGNVTRHVFTPTLERTRSTLEAHWEAFQEHAIECFTDFVDGGKVWWATTLLNDKYDLYVIDDDGYPKTWREFMREVYKNLHTGGNLQWRVTGIFDYHF